MKVREFVGSRFGQWTVVAEARKSGGNRRLLCQCNCGVQKEVFLTSLQQGRSRSCGCVGSNFNKPRTEHGQSYTKAYRAWGNMIDRCVNPKNKRYEQYGGRGIRVCERWQVYGNFIADVGQPSTEQSLDRIDPNGNYEPDNCRWTDDATQAINKRHVTFLTYEGETLCLNHWAKRLGVHCLTIRRRLDKGLSAEEIIGGLHARQQQK